MVTTDETVRSDRALADLPLRAGLWVSLVTGVLIALAQVDRLIAQVPDPQGRTYSVTELTSLTSLNAWIDEAGRRQRQADWAFLLGAAAGSSGERLHGWLIAYALVDLLFVCLYGLLIWWWWRRSFRQQVLSKVAQWPAGLLCLGVVADAGESVMLLMSRRSAVAPDVLPFLSALKWSGLLAGGLWSLVWWSAVRVRSPGASALRRVLSGLYTHRLSVLVLSPLVVLGLPTGSDVLDQLPDIQRRWADSDGHVDLLSAGALTLLATAALFVLGRLRSDSTAMRVADGPGRARTVPKPTVRPALWIWFAGPGVVIAGGLVAVMLGGQVGWMRLGIFCGVPLVIALGSAFLRHRLGTFLPDERGWVLDPARAQPPPGRVRLVWRATKPETTRAQSLTTTLVGDVLAAVLFVLPGLGLVRSFTGVVALGGAGPWDWGLLLVGVIMVAVGWPVAWAVQRLLVGGRGLPGMTGRPALRQLTDAAGGHSPAGRLASVRTWLYAVLMPGRQVHGRRWLAMVILGGSGALVVVLGVWTEPITQALGVLGSLLLALIVLIGIVGSVIVYLQDGGAPEMFWVPGLRVASAPVTTLLVLSALFAGFAGGGADVHGIRVIPDPDTAARQRLDRSFQDWLATGRCEVDLGSGLRARPLLLLAAEGGGIRAAHWTAQAVDILADDARQVPGLSPGKACADVFLSSGASGGAVGLTVADTEPAGGARAAVDAVAGPDALAAASVGLVLTDTVYAATGVPVLSRVDRSWRWVDRAGHMESSWERAVPGLAAAFTAPSVTAAHSPETFGVAGRLVLNSTSATTLCRTLIGQARVDEPGEAAATYPTDPLECTLDRQPPASADLLDVAAQCGQYLARSTAAMLSARFPFVTPSGVVCGRPADTNFEKRTGTGSREQQIVDGGYLENTGVGTIVDLAPEWMPVLRRHNDCVLAGLAVPADSASTGAASTGAASTGAAAPPGAATGCGGDALIVPILVYLDNGTGSDLAAPQPRQQIEPLVPLLTGRGAPGALSRTDAQLRRAEMAFAPGQLWSTPAPAGRSAEAAIEAWRPQAVHVVYQATQPTISAPLGWVLSQTTKRTLTAAMEEAAEYSVLGAQSGATGAAPASPCADQASRPGLLCAKGYGTLGDLRRLLAERRPAGMLGTP